MLTFAQPIELNTFFKNGILKLKWIENTGLVEGPAHICLQSESEVFFYSIFLKNKNQPSIILKDYRSPKTVNPDSSLIQQSIKHQIDANRNIQSYLNGTYFLEEQLALAPIAETFRALAPEPLTASYILPGTATNIPIKASYNNTLQVYEIIVGTIYDAYKNIIADGTNVVFEYSSNTVLGKISATTKNGNASVLLPLYDNENWSVIACINNIKSEKINLVK